MEPHGTPFTIDMQTWVVLLYNYVQFN